MRQLDQIGSVYPAGAPIIAWRRKNTTPVPVNTVAPAVTGVPSSSNTLTCSQGTWTGAVTYRSQWFLDNVPQIGQTDPTFLVTSPMIGSVVKCVVTAQNPGGLTSASSNLVTIIP